MSARENDAHFKATFGITPRKLEENVENINVERLDSIDQNVAAAYNDMENT